jgi:hypothetical protein
LSSYILGITPQVSNRNMGKKCGSSLYDVDWLRTVIYVGLMVVFMSRVYASRFFRGFTVDISIFHTHMEFLTELSVPAILISTLPMLHFPLISQSG